MASQLFSRLSGVAAKYSPISVVVSAVVVAASTTYPQNAAQASMKKSIIYPRLSDSGYEQRLKQLEEQHNSMVDVYNENIDIDAKNKEDDFKWKQNREKQEEILLKQLKITENNLRAVEKRLRELEQKGEQGVAKLET